jgi:hypothetical protein
LIEICVSGSALLREEWFNHAKSSVFVFVTRMAGYASGEPLKRYEAGFVVGGFEYGEAISPNVSLLNGLAMMSILAAVVQAV